MDHFNSRLAKLLALFLAPKNAHVWAITLGRRSFYTRKKEHVPEWLSAHELAHRIQFRTHGVFLFLFRYLKDYLEGRIAGLTHYAAYRNVRYEREAYAFSDTVKELG